MFDASTRQELEGMLRKAALNWLTHDGLWLLPIEEAHGAPAAIELDKKAWETFAVIEAKRMSSGTASRHWL